jgi:uncharacterized repeat protein (TIGR03847 family)
MALLVFDPPERFVAGTVGPPGQRVFFLQARQGSRLLSVSLEKQQVNVLAERINDLLDGVSPAAASEQAALEFADTAPLEAPIEDSFRVNTLSLSWDEDRHRVVIECFDEDPDAARAAGLDAVAALQAVRVVLAPPAARSFAQRALTLVASGRPPCPFCGQPLDPSGHICPRANGYRR